MKTNRIWVVIKFLFGVIVMEFKYLKSDTKRIEKKLEELDKKYVDMEYKKEIEDLEKRCEEVNTNSDQDIKDEIWGQIYKDVLKIEKKSDSKKKFEKKLLSNE
jgi:hypothetical protein